MKTLEDERYVVIKAYKCAVSEIWRDFFILAYIACTSYPYIIIESTDSMINVGSKLLFSINRENLCCNSLSDQIRRYRYFSCGMRSKTGT